MNIKKLIEKWDELKGETQKQILALADKEIKEENWYPEKGENYFYVDLSQCNKTISANCSGSYSAVHIETGNCFRTEEEAIYYLNCEYYTKRFETYVNRHTDKLDWDDDEQLKHFVYYVNDDKKIRYCFDLCDKLQGTTYASSDEVLEGAIDDIGEENFLKYVMKIKTDKER